MAEIPDSIVAIMLFGIPLLAGFFYFYITRKDRRVSDTRIEKRGESEEERDKLALAVKVKKDLQDEAEKVESIRKDIATFVKQEMHEFIEQKIKELRTERDHMITSYEQKMDNKLSLSDQSVESRFKATDLIMANLMEKIVDNSKGQVDAMLKINESIEQLRRFFYELTGKVNRVKDDVDTKESKSAHRDRYGDNGDK